MNECPLTKFIHEEIARVRYQNLQRIAFERWWMSLTPAQQDAEIVMSRMSDDARN